MSSLSLSRSQTFRNPDEDFVLHGQRTSYCEKPDYLSNSQLTSTSERLCQHLKFNPEKYEDRRGNLGNLATKLDRVSQELSNTFTRSVTFSDSMMRKPSMEQIVRIDHLYDKEFPEAKRSRFTPSISRSEKSRYYPTDDYTMVERRDYPLATYDSLAKKYYPVTFSAVLEEEKLKDQLSRSQCMSAPASGRKHAYTRAKSALQKLRQTAVDDKYHKYNSRDFQMMERSNEEKMYSMSREAPTIASSMGMLTTPYESNIATLRRDRLRLEEERLLELKKLEEIEKLRPPREKWYESTGTDFHYECHKNTELEKTEQKWKDTTKKLERNETLMKSLAEICM
ncbi:uncharacterized protein LOC128183965 [Crassostrea angulata]|uniref:uncharacterized protein LOC128183965 n=1 Tax=Magallana angulata TaxID=2784310 RepID=UPI0022B11837|nr:uncharacterized protein LOC128183965 [Crassostrea angulata]